MMSLELIFFIVISVIVIVMISQGRNTTNEKRTMLMAKSRDPAKAKEAFYELGRMIEDSG